MINKLKDARGKGKMGKKRGRSIRYLMKEIQEEQRNPSFIKEVNKFIRESTKIHKI